MSIRMIGTETTENSGRIVLLPIVLLPADTGIYITANRTNKPLEMIVEQGSGGHSIERHSINGHHTRTDVWPCMGYQSLQVVAKVGDL